MGRLLPFSLLYFLSSVSSVIACEGCKEPSSVNGASGIDGISTGFSVSVLFMLAMVASILGGLLWMIVRYCKALDSAHRVAALQPGE